ncbi:MAG TPA: alpha/beta hydrolase [Hypericibacter adhaerens]|jgi:pimeloyl-ACP methyl ester carboxylesterase|uniref:Alpha/beta hydrolase n=1 Tax=Hypericibacter adhaerens TaxID=2602016 RepID=A0A5J6N2R4_9PROT|nr:alpha/beta hydrolase [Hypericibacter adhaerens]QEX24031.1 alpha/beta hydrolase [Hypericibacter adhaerens]HWA44808.1 alpha/beta hydrolase [Hypericibacter adhaerens]
MALHFTVNGRKVEASTGGHEFDPAQPGLIFIHGAGMDHSVWSTLARYFANHGRAVLVPDLPGHGGSEGPLLETIPAMGEWVLKLAEAAKLQSLALAGHSMGALIALEAAAQAPERVKSLALLGAATRMPVHPDLLSAARANDHRAIDMIVSWAHGPVGTIGGQRAPGLWTLGGGVRVLERGPKGALANDLAACDAYQGALAAAAKVRCPTLLILGAEDRMTPIKGAAPLKEALADARQIVLPETGHMMQTERANETIAALKTLLG